MKLGMDAYSESVRGTPSGNRIENVYTRVTALSMLKTAWITRLRQKDKFANAVANNGARPRNLDGNLGYIEYKDRNGVCWGLNLAAGSEKAKNWVDEIRKERRYLNNPGRKQVELDQSVDHRLKSLPNSEIDRSKDSEYVLLNALDQHLQKIKKSHTGKRKLFAKSHLYISGVGIISQLIFLNAFDLYLQKFRNSGSAKAGLFTKRHPWLSGISAISQLILTSALDQHCQKIRNSETGKVEIFTENHPCKSCVHVILQFFEFHPDVSLTLTYALDGDSDAHNKLLEHSTRINALHRGQLRVVKISPRRGVFAVQK